MSREKYCNARDSTKYAKTKTDIAGTPSAESAPVSCTLSSAAAAA